MRPVPLLMCTILLAGCARATVPDTGPYEGLYQLGFEVDSFEPCAREEAWWVTEGEALRARYRELTTREYETVYAVVRGELSAPGHYGHLGAYRRELAVREVLEVRAARPEDCGGAR